MITKLKTFIDGTVRYPVPSALLADGDVSFIEPTFYTNAVKDSNWHASLNLEFNALLKIKHGFLFPLTLLTMSLDANGCFRLSVTPMALLNATKLAWWQKDFINYLGSILERPLVL